MTTDNGQPTADFSAALAAFCTRHEISVSNLSDFGGGAAHQFSRSSAHRLLRGELRPVHVARVRPVLAAALSGWLQTRNLSAEAVERELLTVFTLEEIIMIAARHTLSPEAQEFLGLSRDPFSGDPRSAGEVFTSPALENVINRVEFAVRLQGFVAVSGEIGAGKTVLRKRLQDLADQSRQPRMKLIWPEFFDMSRVTAASIARCILSELDSPIPRDSVAMARKIKRLLGDLHADNVRVAICFDECHRLDDRVLSALKNFWEMGSGGYTRYLGVVMFGQPSFESRLRDFKFREIAERVQIVRMPTLEQTGVDYLRHRLTLAGGDLDALFEADALRLLCAQAKTPLALGNLANAAMDKAATEFGERRVAASFLTQTGLVADTRPNVRAMRRIAS